MLITCHRPSLRIVFSSLVVACRAMSSTSSTKIALGQVRTTDHKLNNLVNAARCAGWAREQSACMLFLPECFGYLGTSSAETLAQCEPAIDEPVVENSHELTHLLQATIDACASGQVAPSSDLNVEKVSLLHGLQIIARHSGLWISATLHTRAPPRDDGQPRLYNTHVILDDHGKLLTSYHKIHLFDVDIPGKVRLQESATTAPGQQLVVCDSPIGTLVQQTLQTLEMPPSSYLHWTGKLGLTTCYDVRFPEVYVKLVELGAEVLLVPSAFTVPTGMAHWHTLLRARAIESQCFVVAAAQYGQHNEKRESYGHSLVVDPWGTVLVDAGGVDGEAAEPPSVVVCEIDRREMESVRQRMPVQQHRAKAKYE